MLWWIKGRWEGGVDWVSVAQDRDKWLALVKAVRFHKMLASS
jgi:hypothetical protein